MQRGHFTRNDSVHAQGDRYSSRPAIRRSTSTIFSPLAGWTSRLNYNLGIYGQDSWTMKRLTIAAGLRLDFQNESADAFTATPGPWLPNRNVAYAEVKDVPNWKDVNPRINAAYDLFGNGKTAIKASASRSVMQDSVGDCERQQSGQHDGDHGRPSLARLQWQRRAGLRPDESRTRRSAPTCVGHGTT